MIYIPQGGVKPLTPDIKDDRFSVHKNFGSVAAANIPKQGLGRKPLKIGQQYSTNFCTGFGTAAASSYQEGIALSAEFQVAAISRIAGAPIIDGTDPRTALKAAVAYGSIPDTLTPDHLRLDPTNARNIANWRNWPTNLWDVGRSYVKAAFFKVDGPQDAFDNIRSALLKGAPEEQVVMAFGKWYQSFSAVGSDGVVPGIGGSYSLHNYDYIDWTSIGDTEYLVAQLSSGEEFGNKGLLYFDRATVNTIWKNVFYDGTGLYIYRDANPNDIQTLKDQVKSLSEVLLEFYQRILFLYYGRHS